MKKIAFIDTEVGIADQKIHDIGGVKGDNTIFHAADIHALKDFLADVDYVCGHNLIHHDLVYLEKAWNSRLSLQVIDTLYLSPLLFPKRPYHHLLKDDKLQVEELNNPVNDSVKAKALFADEVTAFNQLSPQLQEIYYRLLAQQAEFSGFFHYLDYSVAKEEKKGFLHFFRRGRDYSYHQLEEQIKASFQNSICTNVDLTTFIQEQPRELAYALALISTGPSHSTTPLWLIHTFPNIENIIKALCNNPCQQGCPYCREKLDIHKALKNYFGYDKFRTYNNEPLQENAAFAAVNGKSLLAVFPTGGGKSLTFQLPALMAGSNAHGLTVVISPLQSLMKDQVDNLCNINITDAVTINGLLNPLERADAIHRVMDGSANILYISPETLRSKTLERLLIGRNVIRFVIDEAHCFSAWGQDFRVDYLYIADFIKRLQEEKHTTIPVSCFTATAKQKVISDICDYFKEKLDLHLELFAAKATRENLHYKVLYQDSDKDKYITLRSLIEQHNCPTIVYVSRTKRTHELAEQLTSDGFPALPFNGKMESNNKISNQEAFMSGQVKIIVATSAFGMGVDKKDIRLVIHYDISDSLENYVQESGRAGRDPSLEADCYILYNDQDLDKHFLLQNQTKLSISEIQQIWRGIKTLTRERPQVCCSALEIARTAGWDDSVRDIETRVRTAIAALEQAGYIKRGQNVPRIYATSIQVKNMEEASRRINNSQYFDEAQRLTAKRIISTLISSKTTAKNVHNDSESRVDYLADILGLPKVDVIDVINTLRQENILKNDQDMYAYISTSDTENRTTRALKRFSKLEEYLLHHFQKEEFDWALKEINEAAIADGNPQSSVKNISTLLFFLTIKNYIKKQNHLATSSVHITPLMDKEAMLKKFTTHIAVCDFIVQKLYADSLKQVENKHDDLKIVKFSLVGLYRDYLKANPQASIVLQDVKDALLYLDKIQAMKLEGGFLVIYNGMEIKRLILDNHISYKNEDYKSLNDFYQQKIQQIHIIGEFANMMVRNYQAALRFVNDYFHMDYKKFIRQYFKDERREEINRNITSKKYDQLFGQLSLNQAKIINDHESQYIVVVAGPGSGKTRVLVHKLAALLLLEDVKHEQLLMLTFSRAAATEFKKRLIALIGNAAHFVDIKTFHSYCFDLLGKVGNLEGAKNVVQDAAEMIANGEVEPSKIAKSVLVIDEAQDMDIHEYHLLQALIKANDEMRIIAVGDDDQNIYEFRGSDSAYLRSLSTDYSASVYELNDNYRSLENIVALANSFIKPLPGRLKTNPIVATQKRNGKVQLIKHQGTNFEAAILRELQNQQVKTSTCILTNTNQEAMRLLGLLLKHQLPAKLIQSLNGFNLYDLLEIRYLVGLLKSTSKGPTLTEEQLTFAQEKLQAAYSTSPCLEICQNLLREFKLVYSRHYLTDLIEFIRESKLEDFYTHTRDTIYISTIHKSKGREFDVVHMFLDNEQLATPAARRKLYVGMTRAKKELYIHYNNDLFKELVLPHVDKLVDLQSYQPPQELALQLSHRDIFLSSFLPAKKLICSLRSGDALNIVNGRIYPKAGRSHQCLGLLSQSFQQELQKQSHYGYTLASAEIAFILAWYDKEKDKEAAIILPNIHLIKNKNMT